MALEHTREPPVSNCNATMRFSRRWCRSCLTRVRSRPERAWRCSGRLRSCSELFGAGCSEPTGNVRRACGSFGARTGLYGARTGLAPKSRPGKWFTP